MNIKPYTSALRDIYTAVDLSDRIRSLQLYGAATAIYRDLLQFLEAEPGENRVHNHDYIIEKLGYFMENFSNAVMPVEGAQYTPAQRLERANDNLTTVENSI
jgi:hypothetical protein